MNPNNSPHWFLSSPSSSLLSSSFSLSSCFLRICFFFAILCYDLFLHTFLVMSALSISSLLSSIHLRYLRKSLSFSFSLDSHYHFTLFIFIIPRTNISISSTLPTYLVIPSIFFCVSPHFPLLFFLLLLLLVLLCPPGMKIKWNDFTIYCIAFKFKQI